MKTISSFMIFLLVIIGSIALTACDPTVAIKLPPVLSTNETSLITQNSATSGGIINSDNGFEITACGVCWSLKPDPTIMDSLTKDAVGTGAFTSSIKNLLADTTYYVRAYATNKVGTAYGLQVTFKTLQLPGLTTTATTNIKTSTATSGGNVTSDGGTPITSRGVCWSTSANPTISNFHSTDGIGTGSFASNLADLSPETNYYVRAYVTNSIGTFYGLQVTFKTLPLPGLTTIDATNINALTATSGGNVTSDGGTPITSRGVCWSTSANPTISNFHTNDGIGTGIITSNLTGLNPETTYYVRAYATNSIGTYYGNQVSLKTLSATGTVLDFDGNVYHYITIGTQTWMVENLKTTKYNDGTSIPLVTDNTWSALSTPAYCWYNNDATYKNKYGGLYNWYTVNTAKLAPTGWHVPSDSEWTILTNYVYANLGTSLNVAKALAATTDWTICSTTGAIGSNLILNNFTGFSALPGGSRDYWGNFDYLSSNSNGYWWSASEFNSNSTWVRAMYYNYGTMSRYGAGKVNGFSVRCVRDN